MKTITVYFKYVEIEEAYDMAERLGLECGVVDDAVLNVNFNDDKSVGSFVAIYRNQISEVSPVWVMK